MSAPDLFLPHPDEPYRPPATPRSGPAREREAWETEGEARRRTLGTLELRFPPLPQTVFETLALVDEPTRLNADSITAVIQRDPIVVARLLHTVNSAYYGLRQTVSEPERAVVMLGPVAVAGIVLGMHLLKLPSLDDGPAAACHQRLVRHSIATAYLSRLLLDGEAPDPLGIRGAEPLPLGTSFTAGLLHDLGRFVLFHNFPNEAAAFYGDASLGVQVQAPDEREMEQLVFGCDHAEVGEHAARKYHLPEELVDVARAHQAPEIIGTHHPASGLVHAIAIADLAVEAMGFGVGEKREWENVLVDPRWVRGVAALPLRADDSSPHEALLAHADDLGEYVERLTALPEACADRVRVMPRSRIPLLAHL